LPIRTPICKVVEYETQIARVFLKKVSRQVCRLGPSRRGVTSEIPLVEYLDPRKQIPQISNLRILIGILPLGQYGLLEAQILLSEISFCAAFRCARCLNRIRTYVYIRLSVQDPIEEINVIVSMNGTFVLHSFVYDLEPVIKGGERDAMAQRLWAIWVRDSGLDS